MCPKITLFVPRCILHGQLITYICLDDPRIATIKSCIRSSIIAVEFFSHDISICYYCFVMNMSLIFIKELLNYVDIAIYT